MMLNFGAGACAQIGKHGGRLVCGFQVFDLLLLSFLHKNTSEDLKKLFFQKYFAICLGLLFTIGGLIASPLTLTSLTL